MYKNILITTDWSELAGRGIDHGLALAKDLGARVTLVTVSEPLNQRALQAAFGAGVSDPQSRYEITVAKENKTNFAAIEERAKAAGVEIELVEEFDDSPAEAIVRVAKLRGCDLIVMASHGRRGAARLLLGSQTLEVLSRIQIALLVVR